MSRPVRSRIISSKTPTSITRPRSKISTSLYWFYAVHSFKTCLLCERRVLLGQWDPKRFSIINNQEFHFSLAFFSFPFHSFSRRGAFLWPRHFIQVVGWVRRGLPCDSPQYIDPSMMISYTIRNMCKVNSEHALTESQIDEKSSNKVSSIAKLV